MATEKETITYETYLLRILDNITALYLMHKTKNRFKGSLHTSLGINYLLWQPYFLVIRINKTAIFVYVYGLVALQVVMCRS